ncbi:hypothetical protein HBI81_087660 [Parastagonospora nodorum]|nr:hypothetical protein HBI09_095430 [Parastagonospora nodorum]KAH4048891.1 hypothetical protein HBH49_152570 [Parastagonospora nodorum]KAH4103872.1 hypothetical protein HBH46_105830 [Parastagonospora nodorum]KAH4464953.1 hypothetical protein HBH90_105300 [Parastagonospora nodorum]KAH4727208.1 hypothetical protein HBH66_087670 [Parastagonospora nodorum]
MFLFYSSRHIAYPHVIGTLAIFDVNSRRFAEDKLEVVTCNEDEVEEHNIKQRQPNTYYRVIQRWLSNCDAEHLSCSPQPQGSLKRFWVIDVYERNVKLAPQNCDYIALSYVWGYTNAGIQIPLDWPACVF